MIPAVVVGRSWLLPLLTPCRNADDDGKEVMPVLVMLLTPCRNGEVVEGRTLPVPLLKPCMKGDVAAGRALPVPLLKPCMNCAAAAGRVLVPRVPKACCNAHKCEFDGMGFATRARSMSSARFWLSGYMALGGLRPIRAAMSAISTEPGFVPGGGRNWRRNCECWGRLAARDMSGRAGLILFRKSWRFIPGLSVLDRRCCSAKWKSRVMP